MNVKRISGSIGEPGHAEVIDDHGQRWEVPVIRGPLSGRIVASLMMYESETGVGPSMELLGDLNEAVNEFLEDEG